MAKRMRDHKPCRIMASDHRMVLPQWQAMILFMFLAFVLLAEVTMGHSAVADDSEEQSNDALPFYTSYNMAVLEPHRTHGLFRSAEQESDPFCAGILVAAELIVTTQSCVTETGEAWIGQTTTTRSGRTRRTWDKMWSNDDIGVLHLTHPVVHNTDSIIQPPWVSSREVVADDTTTAAVGFQMSSTNSLESSWHTRQATIWSRDECQTMIDSSVLESNQNPNTRLCAGSCQPFLGSPLFVQGNLVGLQSEACANVEGRPGVYIPLASHYEWIRSILCTHGTALSSNSKWNCPPSVVEWIRPPVDEPAWNHPTKFDPTIRGLSINTWIHETETSAVTLTQLGLQASTKSTIETVQVYAKLLGQANSRTDLITFGILEHVRPNLWWDMEEDEMSNYWLGNTTGFVGKGPGALSWMDLPMSLELRQGQIWSIFVVGETPFLYQSVVDYHYSDIRTYDDAPLVVGVGVDYPPSGETDEVSFPKMSLAHVGVRCVRGTSDTHSPL
eukprot:scaffold122904_cov62-Attheya_sp.AAC.2